MNKIISKKEFLENEEFFLKEIKKGKIFIYPTDTIYGLGTNLNFKNSIIKINEIKKRDSSKKLSVIVPNKKWIYENCIVHKNHKIYIDKLPGPYTFIFKLKKKVPNQEILNPQKSSIGIRIPNNFFGKFCSKYKIKFIATSCNISGEKVIRQQKDISDEILKQVNWVILEDKIMGSKGSTIIDLTKRLEKIIRK